MREGLACKKCKLVIAHGAVCPFCGSGELTRKWNGYVVVLDAERSVIAKKLGIRLNSTFALDVK